MVIKDTKDATAFAQRFGHLAHAHVHEVPTTVRGAAGALRAWRARMGKTGRSYLVLEVESADGRFLTSDLNYPLVCNCVRSSVDRAPCPHAKAVARELGALD